MLSLSIPGVNTQNLSIPAVPGIGLIPFSTTTITNSSPTASYLSSPTLAQPQPILQPTILVASQQSIRTHTMTTKSMNNIHKPKQLYLVTKYHLPQPIEPTCMS